MEGLWSYFEKELQSSLSTIELDDIKPSNEKWFLDNNSTGDDALLSEYLEQVIPTWEDIVDKVSGKNGCPLMLILTSGGQRAADLLRETSDFRGKQCKTMKLFAKHLKVDN